MRTSCLSTYLSEKLEIILQSSFACSLDYLLPCRMHISYNAALATFCPFAYGLTYCPTYCSFDAVTETFISALSILYRFLPLFIGNLSAEMF